MIAINEYACPQNHPCPAVRSCPVGAIAYRPYEKHEVDDHLCTRCDMCRQACQDDAIEVL